jgi:hypothetical protein
MVNKELDVRFVIGRDETLIRVESPLSQPVAVATA